MAQSSDMSLGSGGFAAGYTPITFAPLISLTGPVQAQAPAAPTAEAPAAVAPIRYPTMADMPDNAYMTGGIPAYSGASIGNRSSADIRSDFARIGEFLMSPLSTMASVAMTGKMPSENFQSLMGDANPFAGFLQGLQAFFGGGQQQPQVPIGPQMLSEKSQGGVTAIEGIGGAAYNDAVSIASSFNLSSDAVESAGRTAAGLVAQGMDPQTAVTLAANYAAYADRSQMPIDMPKVDLESLKQSILEGTSVLSQVGPQVTGGGYAPSDFGSAGANAPEGSSSLGDAISGTYGYI